MTSLAQAPVTDWLGVTLGLSRQPECGSIKGDQATSIIHNGIILDLVCGFGGSV